MIQLAGAECRQERLAKKTDVKAFKMAEKVEKFIWFQVRFELLSQKLLNQQKFNRNWLF